MFSVVSTKGNLGNYPLMHFSSGESLSGLSWRERPPRVPLSQLPWGTRHMRTGRLVLVLIIAISGKRMHTVIKKKKLAEPNSYLGGKTTRSLETESLCPSSCAL